MTPNSITRPLVSCYLELTLFPPDTLLLSWGLDGRSYLSALISAPYMTMFV